MKCDRQGKSGSPWSGFPAAPRSAWCCASVRRTQGGNAIFPFRLRKLNHIQSHTRKRNPIGLKHEQAVVRPSRPIVPQTIPFPVFVNSKPNPAFSLNLKKKISQVPKNESRLPGRQLTHLSHHMTFALFYFVTDYNRTI